MLDLRRNKINISIPTIIEAGPANPKSEADLSDQSQPGSKKLSVICRSSGKISTSLKSLSKASVLHRTVMTKANQHVQYTSRNLSRQSEQ